MNLLSATPLYNMMFHVILLVLVFLQFHNYFRYIVCPFFMFTIVKPITHSDNGSTRKPAIGKRRVGSGNNGHLSKTFPLEPLCNIFKVSMSQNIVKLRRKHMKRQSFDNCYIQEPVYWLVLM